MSSNSGSTRQQGPAARQAAMAEQVLADGSATAAELAERFGVSLMTIHRDLDELERQGIVRKFRGGVTAQPSGVFESNVQYRLKTMRAEKAAIAEHALRSVEPGMAIMLDDSTSTLEIARRLRLGEITPLTVVTNFLEAINLLSDQRGIHLMALGGQLRPAALVLPRRLLRRGRPVAARGRVLRLHVGGARGLRLPPGAAHRVREAGDARLGRPQRPADRPHQARPGRPAPGRPAVPLRPAPRGRRGVGPEALRDLDEHKVRYEVCATTPRQPPQPHSHDSTRGGDDRAGAT